jgi:hypothetical protein
MAGIGELCCCARKGYGKLPLAGVEALRKKSSHFFLMGFWISLRFT